MHEHVPAEALMTFSDGAVKARCDCGATFIRRPDRPAPAPKRVRPCRRKACLDFYGPEGHIPGVDGPHTY